MKNASPRISEGFLGNSGVTVYFFGRTEKQKLFNHRTHIWKNVHLRQPPSDSIHKELADQPSFFTNFFWNWLRINASRSTLYPWCTMKFDIIVWTSSATVISGEKWVFILTRDRAEEYSPSWLSDSLDLPNDDRKLLTHGKICSLSVSRTFCAVDSFYPAVSYQKM